MLKGVELLTEKAGGALPNEIPELLISCTSKYSTTRLLTSRLFRVRLLLPCGHFVCFLFALGMLVPYYWFSINAK